MTKLTAIKATDPVVSRKAAIPGDQDHGKSSVFTSGIKALAAITAIAAVVSFVVPAALGVAVFTGLLTVLAFATAFMAAVKFATHCDPDLFFDDNSTTVDRYDLIEGRSNPVSSQYYVNDLH